MCFFVVVQINFLAVMHRPSKKKKNERNIPASVISKLVSIWFAYGTLKILQQVLNYVAGIVTRTHNTGVFALYLSSIT